MKINSFCTNNWKVHITSWEVISLLPVLLFPSKTKNLAEKLSCQGVKKSWPPLESEPRTSSYCCQGLLKSFLQANFVFCRFCDGPRLEETRYTCCVLPGDTKKILFPYILAKTANVNKKSFEFVHLFS